MLTFLPLLVGRRMQLDSHEPKRKQHPHHKRIKMERVKIVKKKRRTSEVFIEFRPQRAINSPHLLPLASESDEGTALVRQVNKLHILRHFCCGATEGSEQQHNQDLKEIY